MKNSFSVLILFVGILTSLSVFGQAVAPGYWSAVTKFKVDGFSLPDSTGSSCVAPDQATDIRGTLVTELTKIGCVITQWNLTGSNVQAALTCKDNDIKASGKIRGTFSEKSYHLKGSARGFYKNSIPSAATIDLTGQWLRDCGADPQ